MQDLNLYVSLKWSLVLICIVNICYSIYLFFTLLASNQRKSPLFVWLVCALIVLTIGLFGAGLESFILVLVFAILLVINLIFTLTQHSISIGIVFLYLIVLFLTFLFCYLIFEKDEKGEDPKVY